MTSVTGGWEGTPAWALARNLAVLERAQRAAEQASRLGVADARLLWLFGDGAPRTLREVSETLGLEQSTVNRQVNTALVQGLLRRYREPGQSAHLLEATNEGIARLTESLRWRFGLFDTAFAALPSTERDRFVKSLTLFVDAYAQIASSSDPLRTRHVRHQGTVTRPAATAPAAGRG